MNYSENIVEVVNHFFFMFIRIAAIFTISPVFGRKNVPYIVKIGLSLLLTVILFEVYPPTGGNIDRNLLEFFVLCTKQVIVGLIIGLITTCFFAAVTTAGQFIDVQIGFSSATLFDPQFNTQISITGNLLNTVLLICFFLVDGHHMLIRLIAESFRLVPIDNVVIQPQIAMAFAEIFIKTFVISIQIAMPIIVASLISEVVMGVMMRMVPQLNFFVVGFPIKIGIGLLVLFAMIPAFVNSCDGLFDNMINAIGNVFEGMST